jgi:hypothetical protein
LEKEERKSCQFNLGERFIFQINQSWSDAVSRVFFSLYDLEFAKEFYNGMLFYGNYTLEHKSIADYSIFQMNRHTRLDLFF